MALSSTESDFSGSRGVWAVLVRERGSESVIDPKPPSDRGDEPRPMVKSVLTQEEVDGIVFHASSLGLMPNDIAVVSAHFNTVKTHFAAFTLFMNGKLGVSVKDGIVMYSPGDDPPAAGSSDIEIVQG